jgi:hypothetical protein
MTKEKALGLLTLLFAFLKPFLFRWWNKWAADRPAIERFLISVTFGRYHRDARKREEETKQALRESLVKDKVDDLITELRIRLELDRVTVSSYRYTGPLPFPENPVLIDFTHLNITVTNESTGGGIQPIMDDWQDRSGAAFAKAFYMLHYSEKGYISIGPNDEDDLTEAQNMFDVTQAWRFKMSKDATLFDGLVVLSVMFGKVPPDFSEEKIRYIKLTVRKIHEAKHPA